jgi:hypothetical protein
MSLDDALELAEQVLVDYETSYAPDGSGLTLVWVDQLADVLRKLAAAARDAGPADDLAHVTLAGCPAGGPGGGRPGRDGGLAGPDRDGMGWPGDREGAGAQGGTVGGRGGHGVAGAG